MSETSMYVILNEEYYIFEQPPLPAGMRLKVVPENGHLTVVSPVWYTGLRLLPSMISPAEAPHGRRR